MFWVCVVFVWDVVFVAFEEIYAILFALQGGNTPRTTIAAIQGSFE